MSSEYSDQHGFDPSDLRFDSPDVISHLESLSMTDLALVRFCVIGVNEAGITTRYNLRESDLAGRPSRQVLGHSVNEALAPILNASQLVDYLAAKTGAQSRHDEIFSCDLLDVLGVQIRMRMVCDPAIRTRYLLIDRPGG